MQFVALSVQKCNFNGACYSSTWFPLMQLYPRTCKGSCLVRAIKIPGCIMPQLFLIGLRHAGWQHYHNKPRRIFIRPQLSLSAKQKYGWNNARSPLSPTIKGEKKRRRHKKLLKFRFIVRVTPACIVIPSTVGKITTPKALLHSGFSL